VFLASIAGVGLLQSYPALPRFYLAGAGLLLAPLGLCLSIWSVWHLRSSFSILAEARHTVDSGRYWQLSGPIDRASRDLFTATTRRQPYPERSSDSQLARFASCPSSLTA
jgi:hypothetical protein